MVRKHLSFNRDNINIDMLSRQMLSGIVGAITRVISKSGVGIYVTNHHLYKD